MEHFDLSASLCRGKCKVKKLSEVRDSLSSYVEKEHTFFFNYGYKPESRGVWVCVCGCVSE